MLGAGPLEMALLVVSASLAVLLVGFLAGAWVDRVRRRPLLIWTDAIRAAPAPLDPGGLCRRRPARCEQLYVVVFVEACLGALFDAAYPAYVPSLIGVDRVVDGNSKLATSSSIAEIGGPGLAGALVQVVSAPFAILVDAISFAVSAVSLLLIRAPEPAGRRGPWRRRIRGEIVEGLQLVRRHRVLLPITLRSVIAHVAGSFYGVLYTLYLSEDLHLSPFLLGIVVSAGGVGSLVGSFFAARVIGALRARPGADLDGRSRRVGPRRPDAARPGRRSLLATLMVFIPAARRRRPPDDRGRRRDLAHPGADPGPDPRPRERDAGGLLARDRLPDRGARWRRRSRARSASAAGSPSAGPAWPLSILLLVLSPLPRSAAAVGLRRAAAELIRDAFARRRCTLTPARGSHAWTRVEMPRIVRGALLQADLDRRQGVDDPEAREATPTTPPSRAPR